MKGITYTQVAQYCVMAFAYTIPAIFIKGRLGLFGVVKNNTGKYHGGRLQTTNNHLWKKHHTTTKNVNKKINR